MIDHAVYLGDFVEERSVLLARVPEDALVAAQVRALHFLVGEDAALTPLDYWIVQLGVIMGGQFRIITPEMPLNGQMPAAVLRRLPVEAPALLSRGTSLAVRLTPRGQPPPLAGASCIVEWGIQASRRE